MIVAMVAVIAIFSITILFLLLTNDSGVSQSNFNKLESEFQQIKATQNAALAVTPTPVNPDQDRLTSNFLIGKYDEETILFVFKKTQDEITRYDTTGSQSNPHIAEGFVLNLSQGFDYLAGAVANGMLKPEPVLSQVERFESASNSQYAVRLNQAPGYDSFRETLGRLKYIAALNTKAGG